MLKNKEINFKEPVDAKEELEKLMGNAEGDDYDIEEVSDLEYGSEEGEDEYDSELEQEFFGKKKEDKDFNLKEFKDQLPNENLNNELKKMYK